MVDSWSGEKGAWNRKRKRGVYDRFFGRGRIYAFGGNEIESQVAVIFAAKGVKWLGCGGTAARFLGVGVLECPIMPTSTETIQELASHEYKWGWNVDMEADEAPMGLNE